MLGLVQILGGLALFMFGIHLLSSGMEKLAGEQIQKWLDRATSSRIKSALFGTAATAAIQSSGLLMVTMIGLINANLMTVPQAIGVMLGQEIGTTLTAQIVAFDIGNYRLILVILGLIFLEFFPKKDWKKYGEIFMGLGIIFVGMGFMSQSLHSLVEIPWVSSLLVQMGKQPWIGILAGIVLTALTQSSTAVTSMTVAMGMTHAISLPGAVGIILGANIGSCITGLMASARLSRAARQASLAQILINVFGVLVFLPFITPFSNLVAHTSDLLPRQIANAHTIFNLAVSLLLFPFPRQISQIVERLVSTEKKPSKIKATHFIDDAQYSVPAVALTEASRELVSVGKVAGEMIGLSCQALIDEDMQLAKKVFNMEDQVVDPVYHELVMFVNHLMREDLSIVQQKRCFQIKNLLIDVERVGDIAEDIAQLAQERVENNVTFSSQAMEELDELWRCAQTNFLHALHAYEASDREEARLVCRSEIDFDRAYWSTRQLHIERLEAGLCHPEADVIYTEVLRCLERISDHADNLGVSVVRS